MWLIVVMLYVHGLIWLPIYCQFSLVRHESLTKRLVERACAPLSTCPRGGLNAKSGEEISKLLFTLQI